MTPVLIVHYRDRPALNRAETSIYEQSVCCTPMVWENSVTNLGYTAGMNKLLHHLDGGYAVLIGQDVVLMPDAVEKAILFMESHPKCAIAGFKQLDPDDPDIITHGGTGEAFPAGQHLGGRVSNGDCAVSRPFYWVNGAAMIVRLDALSDIGYMDERFFLYGSDSDWCYTAGVKGWEVWYCAEAVCLHKGGCARTPTPEQNRRLAQDMQAWAEKWAGICLALTDNPS